MFDQVHNNNRGQTLLTDQTSGIPPTGRRHFAFPLVRSVIREPCDIIFFLCFKPNNMLNFEIVQNYNK